MAGAIFTEEFAQLFLGLRFGNPVMLLQHADEHIALGVGAVEFVVRDFGPALFDGVAQIVPMLVKKFLRFVFVLPHFKTWNNAMPGSRVENPEIRAGKTRGKINAVLRQLESGCERRIARRPHGRQTRFAGSIEAMQSLKPPEGCRPCRADLN